jgi:O-antigen ligase
LLFLLPAASVWFVSDWLGDEQSAVIRYYTETTDESLDRFQDHGFGALAETYRQTGFFGAGLGTATPGSHNIDVERPHTWQESGTSRILVELGVPGALGFLAVMVNILLGLWRVTQSQMRRRSPEAAYVAGLVAFFLANVGSLIVSGQILADPFIAAFLGFLVGIALSFARPQLSGEPGQSPQPAPAVSEQRPEFARGLRH